MEKYIIIENDDEQTNEQNEKISSNNQQVEIFTAEDTGYQAIKWFFTYHIKNDDEQFEQAFKRLEPLKELCDKYVWGEEYGKEGKTPHIQGAFILKAKMRATTIQKNFFKNGVWTKKLKNWQAALNYCIKECNQIHCSEKFPKPVKTIQPVQMFPWQLEILDMINKEPEDRKIYWYWGKQGIGKSAFQKYLVVHHGAQILSGKPSDMKHAIVEYKKNNNGCTPELIISNIGYDKDLSRIHYHGYEDIKDMCFHSGKYEGGMVTGNEPHLLIFANGPPETENVKFIVKELTDACA